MLSELEEFYGSVGLVVFRKLLARQVHSPEPRYQASAVNLLLLSLGSRLTVCVCVYVCRVIGSRAQQPMA